MCQFGNMLSAIYLQFIDEGVVTTPPGSHVSVRS